ncbi:MAG: FixH family protein [Pirellulales bacterium]|nr:FixH family protein [Pirellulales bacterium]
MSLVGSSSHGSLTGATLAAHSGNLDAESSELKARWLWGAVIVGLLLFQIAACLLIIYLATSDASMAVVPEYHEKALHWDDAQAAQRASDALGWQASWAFDDTVDVLGRREIRLSLHDASGRPVGGAMPTVEVFHHAHAAAAERFTLVELGSGSGLYSFVARVSRPGIWELRLRAVRGQDTFLWNSQNTLNELTSPTPPQP